jgi:pSer/pThr/pTyr-binding forkhead associated (FHA) protein
MVASVTLRIKSGKLAGKTYAFREPQRCLIGRGSDCEIRLPSEAEFLTVSRYHCLLDIDPPAIRVRDSGSRNGTYINGMQIGRPASWQLSPETLSRPCFDYDLTPGDELRVGETVFEIGVVRSEEDEPVRLEAAETDNELCACG